MIQKGIFAKIFQRESVLKVFQAVKEHGFLVAQFNFACVGLPSMPEEVSDTILAEIKAAKLVTEMEFVGVSGTYNMAHPDKKVRLEDWQKLKVLAGVCPKLDIPLITLCTGSRNTTNKWAFHPENSSKSAWKDMLDSMEKAIEIAQQYDLYLGIEPELANVVNSPHKAYQLIKEMRSHRLKIILDPANLFEKAEVPKIKRLIEGAVDLLAPHIVMAHAKDRDANGDFVPPGKGIIPFDFFKEQLKEADVDYALVAHGFEEKEVSFVSSFLEEVLVYGYGKI